MNIILVIFRWIKEADAPIISEDGYKLIRDKKAFKKAMAKINANKKGINYVERD